MPILQLLRLQCINPATSFGDDIVIRVDGEDAGGEFGIDKGQTHNLNQFVFSDFEDGDQAEVTFLEDNDFAASLEIPMTPPRKQTQDVTIKNDGHYKFTYRVRV